MTESKTSLGFQAGLVASAVAGLVMLLARLAYSIPAVPELVLDQATAIVPPALFAFVLDRLLFAAKPLMLGFIVVGQLLVGGALGVVYARRIAADDALVESRRGLVGLGIGAAIWLVTGLVVFPLLGAGLFGSALPDGPVGASVALLLAALAFGLVLVGLTDWAMDPAQPDPHAATTGRRSFIRSLAIGSVAVAAAASAVRAASLLSINAASAQSSRRPPESLPPEITPTRDFYVVSKNIADPIVDETKWSLEITGLVENPIKMSYAELTALPSSDQAVTLECISNEIGGNLISNANWKGVRFRDLLAMARPTSGATKVWLTGADGYDDSISFDRAMSPANLLAWEMNGEKLPPGHGFPARLLVPGIYGMKNVKWVTKIHVIDYDFKGYWQQRGWSDDAFIKTMSRIDVPSQITDFPTGETMVGGIAFSGDRGISQVEVSFDDGKTWQRAIVRKPLSQYTWVLWSLDWSPPPGKYTLKVRAYDLASKQQESEFAETLPDGASGYHSFVVNIQPA